MMRRRRYFCLPCLFLAVHSALVLFVWALVASPGGDGETGMVWIVFRWIDWPVSKILFQRHVGDAKFVVMLLAVGGTWWLILGFAAQLISWGIRPPRP